MIYILLIIFIIILFYYINKNIIIENYFQDTQQEEQTPINYSKNVCGAVGKECSIINHKTNTCCDGLYCVRPKGFFHNKFCSKTPDKSKEKSFKVNIINIGNYMNGFIKKNNNKRLNINTNDCVEEEVQEEEEEEENSNNYNLKNICKILSYNMPIHCMMPLFEKNNKKIDIYIIPKIFYDSVIKRDVDNLLNLIHLNQPLAATVINFNNNILAKSIDINQSNYLHKYKIPWENILNEQIILNGITQFFFWNFIMEGIVPGGILISNFRFLINTITSVSDNLPLMNKLIKFIDTKLLDTKLLEFPETTLFSSVGDKDCVK
jgi:hypothetical protein